MFHKKKKGTTELVQQPTNHRTNSTVQDLRQSTGQEIPYSSRNFTDSLRNACKTLDGECEGKPWQWVEG
jgi:hypothetical protein